MKRPWLRRTLAAAGVASVLLAGGCLALTSTTSYSQHGLAYIGRPGDAVPPSWTRPCVRFGGDYYLLPCGRVEGVILYREGRDRDRDGDVHGLAVAGRRLVIVKSKRGAVPIPGVGRRVDLAGTTTRGRFGLTVVDVVP